MAKKFSFLFMLLIISLAGAAAAQVEQGLEPQTEQNVPQAVENAPQAVTAETPAAEEPKKEIIKGIIKEIAADGSFIIIGDTKILTTKEFLDDSYLEVDDNVEITAEVTTEGLKAVNYNYIFEEESLSAIPEESPSQEQDLD